MKVGVLGTRHVHAAGFASAAVRSGATIVGAYEPDAEAATAWELSPVVSLEELLAQSDAIIVGGTNRERVDGVIAATAAGLPTLSEKPVAVDADDLERLVANVDPALVMVALPVRFAASIARAREAVQAGAIGTPFAARGTNHGQFPGGWFGDLHESGGGALQDHVVHVADLLCWLTGDRVISSYAVSSRAMYPDLAVDSCGVVTLDFASGMFASIDASWTRPVSFPTWGDVWLELVGTEGRIVLDPMATRVEVFDDAAGKLTHVPYSDDDMTQAMVDAFLAFARDGGTAPVTLAEGIHASDIVRASYASAASGRAEAVTQR